MDILELEKLDEVKEAYAIDSWKVSSLKYL